jgi:hypothetical protein
MVHRQRKNKLKRNDLLRYALWGAVAATAEANRRHYHMQTTWLPHLLTNSLSLLLPDAMRALLPRRPRNEVEQILACMARDNDDYVVYVAPLAVGYILSHPKFNIYKGDWAQIRLAGFGLDAIPHSATAMALTALVIDSARVTAEVENSPTLLSRLIDWAGNHAALTSLGVLGALTLIWEYGEYGIHQHEMALRGDATQINMQWSAEDTAADVASNLIGWAAGVVLRR